MRRIDSDFLLKHWFNENAILNKDLYWPKISIIIVSYNQDKFIERTILSVLNQNYPNLEVIVIDGGSADESVSIIKKYEKYLTYWISEHDEGQADGLNKGFKRATGDLVAWQNSDDIYLPGAFFEIAKAAKKFPDKDVFFGNTYIINAKDEIIEEARTVPFLLSALVYKGWNLSSQSVFWRSKVFEEVKYLKNYKVLFDFDWFIRLGKKYKFKFVHEFIGGYRYHSAAKLSVVDMDTRSLLFVRIMAEHGYSFSQNKEPWGQFPARKFMINLRNLFWYCVQGDLGFILKRILAKFK